MSRNHRRILVSLAACGLVALPLATTSRAALVSMTADDGFGTSSFTGSSLWSNSSAPAAGNDYANANFLLRTPADGNSYTFAGDSLTITSDQPLGAQLNDALIYKGTASSTITINNLTFDGGVLRHGNNQFQTFTLDGNGLTVGPNGMAVHTQGPIDVVEPVAGSGLILIQPDGDDATATKRLIFSNAANTFTGNISLANSTQSRFMLNAGANLNFVIGASGVNNGISGSGVVELNGLFDFDLSAAGTTLGDAWTIVDNATLNETFGDAFAVAGFGDGGDNTWFAVANGAAYRFDESTGVLSVVPVPEPASLSLVALAATAALSRRRRSSHLA